MAFNILLHVNVYKWSTLYFSITGYALKHLSRLIGIKWELRQGDILEVERGAVIVANHQSVFDVLGKSQAVKQFNNCIVYKRKISNSIVIYLVIY